MVLHVLLVVSVVVSPPVSLYPVHHYIAYVEEHIEYLLYLSV